MITDWNVYMVTLVLDAAEGGVMTTEKASVAYNAYGPVVVGFDEKIIGIGTDERTLQKIIVEAYRNSLMGNVDGITDEQVNEAVNKVEITSYKA